MLSAMNEDQPQGDFRVPRRTSRILKRASNATKRRHLLRSLAERPCDTPNPPVLEYLRSVWGPTVGAASASLLYTLCNSATRCRQPILECGSGLSTLLLGIYAPVPVWSLEESTPWAEYISTALRRYKIEGVTVVHCPLRQYANFSWYQLPQELPPTFDLMLCDGPQAYNREGLPRYGLIPLLGERLSEDGHILLDDTDRPSEAETLRLWAEHHMLEQAPERNEGNSFAILRRPR
jgi:hypothetical protein